MSNRRTKRSATSASMVALASLPVGAALFTAPAHAAGDLVLIPDFPLALTLGVLFAALIFPLNALIFKPIFGALDERSSRITGARDRAAHIQSEAASALSRYEDSIREARMSAESGRKEQLADARSEQTSISGRARAEAERRVEQARGELERSLEEARGTLRTEAQQLARVAAEQILGRNLS
jgi:F-type H+-transporting ATPase subunit b